MSEVKIKAFEPKRVYAVECSVCGVLGPGHEDPVEARLQAVANGYGRGDGGWVCFNCRPGDAS